MPRVAALMDDLLFSAYKIDDTARHYLRYRALGFGVR